MPATRSPRTLVPLVLLALTLAGLALRLATLDQSFFGDELYAYREVVAKDSLSDVLSAMRHNGEVTPPLFFIVGWLAVKLGDPFTWLRLPSLVAGVLTVPVVYAIGERSVSRRAGLVAASLVALSPFAIFYSTEARPYGLLALASALSTLALLVALETGRRAWWIAFSLATAATIYLHYSAIFLVLAQAAWALAFHRDRWRELVASYAFAAVAFVPWIATLASNYSSLGQAPGVLFFPPLTLDAVLSAIARWMVGAPFVALDRLPGAPALALSAAGVAVGALGAARGRLRGRKARPETLLVWLLAVAAPAGIVASSLVGRSILASRNFYSSLPALAVAIAALVTAPRRRLVAAAAVALTLSGLAVGALTMLEPDSRRPANEAAAAFIERHSSAGDPILQRYYSAGGRQSPLQALSVHLERPHRVFAATTPAGLRGALALAGRRRLIVANHCVFNLCVGTRQMLGTAAPTVRNGFRLVAVRRFSGFETITVSIYEPRR